MKFLPLILVLLLCSPALAGKSKYSLVEMRPLLNCMWDAESSKRRNPPDGDGGNSIGPYQIQEAYWADAIEYDPDLGGKYTDCRTSKLYSEKIILAYWSRYAKGDTNPEKLARMHNGGPKGHLKPATLKYWHKDAFDPVRK